MNLIGKHACGVDMKKTASPKTGVIIQHEDGITLTKIL
jgi:hypothetical protein